MKKSSSIAALCLSALSYLSMCTQLAAQTPPSAEPETPAPAGAEPEQSEVPRTLINPNDEHLKLLAEEVDDNDLRWLETSSGKFLAVWEPNKSDNPFGAVLLLHGDGESTESPHTIRALRENLSRHGWATLAISLPPMAVPKVPPRAAPSTPDSAEAEANAAATQTAASVPDTDPEQISDERLRSAINFLYQQGQYNIVTIGHGLGALRAARFIDTLSASAAGKTATKPEGSATSNRPIRAFVMIEARNQIPTDDANIGDYFNDPTLPVLDIYYGDHYLDRLFVKQRRQLASEKQIKEYFQVKVLRPTTSDSSSENRLTRRVRGFLSQHAKGVAVERRRGG